MKTALVLTAALVLVTTGCQSFSLTDAEFDRQQHGQPVDPEVGTVVGVTGSAAYLGALIGAAVAGAK